MANPWGIEDDWLEEMKNAKPFIPRRFLLETPFSVEWYLGERIVGCDLPLAESLVPPELPTWIFWPELTGAELVALRIIGELVRLEGDRGDYPGFIGRLLGFPQVDPLPPPPRARGA